MISSLRFARHSRAAGGPILIGPLMLARRFKNIFRGAGVFAAGSSAATFQDDRPASSATSEYYC